MRTVLYFYEHRFTAMKRRLKGIYAAANEFGWRVQPVDWRECGMTPARAVAFWGARGAIVEGGVFEDGKLPRTTFEKLGIPTVYCDPDESRMRIRPFAVCHDSAQTARAVIAELLALDYSAYGFVGYRIRREWSDVREGVFAAAMEKAGMPHFSFDPCELENLATAEHYFTALKDWLRALPRPCGILAANDEMGERVIAAANELGLVIPDDIAVVGIDDDEVLCESTKPPLASVSPDFEESGRLAVRLLSRRIHRPSMKPVVLKFGTTPFRMRGSMRILKRKDYSVSKAMEYIRLHATEGIGVDDVVAVMNTGRRTAEERFRRFAGKSIMDEIEDVRLDAAKRLLSDPQVRLDELHERCGYAGDCVFRRFFKRRTGFTPGEWRKSENLQSLS